MIGLGVRSQERLHGRCDNFVEVGCFVERRAQARCIASQVTNMVYHVASADFQASLLSSRIILEKDI
jgi:hypothetical protein